MATINDETVLQKVGDIPFRIIEGEAVLVNTGTHEVIHLNDTGTFVWENINGDSDLGTIVKRLMDEFEVEEAAAREDVLSFASNLIEKGLIAKSRTDNEPA
ncbi:MAG: PqqD family protein [bacterium]